ncbi:ABC transporter ATP-binding protein [Anoxybacter fermentans]|uniref:ABC transporter ATP-binding protein n=1 Tax=Anoxybacter fermentans TaxID=1323375 RepID=A0A3Q9HRW5_9FIRM|nr:ABC transporter ATP-binding protein [Anoxybacter fermentans]AZR73946.1 ABC transporter ATP-binding protein [Anoxybacter fermentans]
MNLYRRFFRYFESLKLKLFLGMLCLVLVSVANLIIPKLLENFIDLLTNSNVRDLNSLNLVVIGFLVLYFFKGIFHYGQVYLLAYVGQRVVLKLRMELYKHLQYLSLAFHQKMRVGELISRVTNDIQVVENSVTLALPGLIGQPIIVIGAVIMAFVIHWKLAAFTMTIIPFIAIAISKFGAKMRKTSGKIQSHMSDITTIVQENFSSIRIVKAFSREEDEIERFNDALCKNFSAGMKAVQIMATMTPVIELISAVGIVTIFWYGSREVIRGNLTTGQLVGFMTYMAILVTPLKLISRDLSLVHRALGALERIFEILDVKEFIREKENAVELPPIKGYVKFHHVSLRYQAEEEEVLKDICLEVKPGQVVAFVGESGAGKTSLVNLIPRFYDPTSGKITIDGYDIRDVTIDSLRQQIAIVPQETILFKGTIAYNIAYGKPDASMEEIVMAAKRANAHDFITKFSKGYETMVGERGQSLSGGQRQRIAIARAILADPRILILDEATSALDTASELLVQEALQEVMANRTTFVIAHRLSTIVNADLIVVLDKGRIVEMGTHKELLEKKGYYYRLYKAQQKNKGGI